MVTVILNKGYFLIEGNGGKFTVRMDSVDLPAIPYRNVADKVTAALPPIADVCRYFERQNVPAENMIDRLVALYLPYRVFRVGHFKNLSTVMGFGGHRGSGKSISAVMVTIFDYLLRGYLICSNIQIRFIVRYGEYSKEYSSEPIEKLEMFTTLGSGGFQKCLVLIDEVNMEGAESTRYMSGANLGFANQLQQIRKRGVSIIWTCQSFNWLDARTRFQTDFLIYCEDGRVSGKCAAKDVGHKSIWTVMDLSGLTGSFDFEYEMAHRWISDFAIGQWEIWTRPWWGFYPTDALQGQDNYVELYRNRDKKIPGQPSQVPTTYQDYISDLVNKIAGVGIDKIYCDQVWKMNGITEKPMQTSIGIELSERGYSRGRDRQGYYWSKNNGGKSDGE